MLTPGGEKTNQTNSIPVPRRKRRKRRKRKELGRTIAAVVDVSVGHRVAVAVLRGVERVLGGLVERLRLHGRALVVQAGVVGRRRLRRDRRSSAVSLLHFEEFLELLGAPAAVAVEDDDEDEDQGADDAGHDDGHHVLGRQVRQRFGRLLHQVAFRTKRKNRIHIEESVVDIVLATNNWLLLGFTGFYQV